MIRPRISPPGKEKSGTKPDRFDAISRNPYWLNVVRFFCGCFSKGELLDLADRVGELIGDTLLGKSRHPALLGAMLLADWVFAQSPKAVDQVAKTLSTRDSLRRLLGKSVKYHSEQELQIPASCGGSLVLRKAFDFLEDPQTRPDLGRRLSAFINMNASAGEIDVRWLASAQHTLHNQVERWLRIGRDLGSLERVDKGPIMAVIGNGLLDDSIVDLLCSAGRYDCVLTSDANATLFESRLLSTVSRDNRPPSWGKDPLYLLPMFLSLPHFAIGRGMFGYEAYLEALDRFKNLRSAREPGLKFEFDFSQRAFELSCKIADLLIGETVDRTSSMEWERLLEECRTAFGNRPAILLAANNMSRIRSRRRLKPVDLANEDRPICDRIRWARSQATDATWWGKQLGQVSNSADQFLFHLVYWTCTPIDVVFEMADGVAANLSELPAEKWSTLLSCLRAMGPVYNCRGGGASANQPLPQRMPSRRLAFLIGVKAPVAYGREIFLAHFRDNSHDCHSMILGFRQLWAFEAALSCALPWQSALSIIRSTYTRGASQQIAHLLLGKRIALPDSVADEILTKAKRYPVDLWEIAEANASERTRRAIRPVGRVARDEHWSIN